MIHFTAMKRTYIIRIAFLSLINLVNLNAQAVFNWIDYAQPVTSGDGSRANPFLIETPEHLAFVAAETKENRNFNGLYLKITQDIDLSGKEWTPIGSLVSAGTLFSGTLDGGKHVIKNMEINAPDVSHIGLFGASRGVIENLNIENCSVSGFEYVGGLVGFIYEGAVNNCMITGKVEGKHNRVGLLTGQNDGSILGCSTSGNITGKENVGGFAGINYGLITESTSAGHVQGENQVGGFVGLLQKGKINNCKAACKVEGAQENIGGFLGQNSAAIANCQASGDVAGRMYVGGFAGWNYYGSVDNCSASGNLKGTAIVGGLIGSNETDQPLLKCFATGRIDGTEGNIGGLVGMNHGQVTHCHATGNVVGKDQLGGLIGISQAGAIVGCCAKGSVEGTGDRIGGLIGKNNGAMAHCYATGNVSGRNLIGGLVGADKEGCPFSNCYASGVVRGSGIYIGGLLGQCLGSVVNCYASGSVSGNQYLGGIVGAIFGTLKNSVSACTSIQTTTSRFGGRIFGEAGEGAVVENNYALRSTLLDGKEVNPKTVNNNTGINKEQIDLFLQNTYQSGLSWDFDTVWKIQDGAGLPTLK